MPRAHDRGGRPTDTTIDRTERVLHDWERRIDAIVFALRNKGIASVDQMRLALESLPPTQYETLRYYEKWAAAAESNLAAAGIIAPEELDQKMADLDPPIDRADPTLSDWERRIDAIAQLLASKGVVTPQDMKSRPAVASLDDSESSTYFEQWAAAAEAVLTQKGILSNQDLDRAMAAIEAKWGSDA